MIAASIGLLLVCGLVVATLSIDLRDERPCRRCGVHFDADDLARGRCVECRIARRP